MFKVTQTSIRTLKSSDPKFHIIDGLVMAPRAGFEISDKCPREYKSIILDCIDRGWLKPIANVKDNELFWEKLGE
jgi:hypothetical protein